MFGTFLIQGKFDSFMISCLHRTGGNGNAGETDSTKTNDEVHTFLFHTPALLPILTLLALFSSSSEIIAKLFFFLHWPLGNRFGRICGEKVFN